MSEPISQALRFEMDEATAAPRTMIEEWLERQRLRILEPSVNPSQYADDEAEYCLARAEAEDRCAQQATHPAARDAHLQLALLYRQRVFAAQPDNPQLQEWIAAGGTLLPEK